MKKVILILSFVLFDGRLIGAEEDNVIYKFRKYEKFDLGNLKIQGSIMAPGDISVKERERKEFNRALLERTSFDPEVKDDVSNLR
jgi:hypothetical protein